MQVGRNDYRISKRGYVISIIILIVILFTWASCDRLFGAKKERRVNPAVMVVSCQMVHSPLTTVDCRQLTVD